MLLASFPLTSAEPVLHWRRTFPGRPDQARVVRQFVATLLPDRPRLDEVLLAVGELVANALRHSHSGQGGTFTVGIRHAAGCTAVSVTDEGGPAEPVVTDADDLAESGRGLRTISVLADSWGWHGDDTGRTVTVIFAAEAPGAVTDDACRPVSRGDRRRRSPVDAVGDADRTHLGDVAADHEQRVRTGAGRATEGA